MTAVHGRRLLPNTIDQIAENDPNRAWASAPVANSLEFQDISIFRFANAINRVAHWIIQTVGAPPTASTKPVLAYIGASDLRYYVLVVATVKAGYVPLFTSHLNSKAANASLFNATGCKILLCGFDDLTNVALDPQGVQVFHIPSLEAVWDATPVTPFPFTKSFDDAFHDPLLILHTSGSTGMPKPITYTHGSFAARDTRQDLPDFDGCESEPRFRCRASRALLGLPPFHAAGFVTGLQDTIFFGVVIVFPPSDRPLDAQCVLNIIDHGRIEGATLLPHVLEDLARTAEALKRLRELRYVGWVGGPISQQAGDLISAQTTLINTYASTELGAGNTLINRDRTLWPYYYFHPLANGFEFRPVQGQSNIYELFVRRDPNLSQPVFCIFPHLDEWPMKDLFSPHPNLPHHWRLEGRSDDLIVFQNGSKLNPRAIEAMVKCAPGVRDALMFGAGRTRPGILVEPHDARILEDSNTASEVKFLNAVFPFVEESNQTAPENGKIVRELLALNKKDKPFPRSGKRTIQRNAALEMYENEINALYDSLPSNLKRAKDFRIGSEATIAD